MTVPSVNLKEAIKDYSPEAILSFLIWCCELQVSPNVVSLETWMRTTWNPSHKSA